MMVWWLRLAAVVMHLVAVQVHDQHGNPVPGMPVTLYLYEIWGQTAYQVPIGSCETDAHGQCCISVPNHAPRDAAGLFRGVLRIGEDGYRSVLWPGGTLQVRVRLGYLHEGREAEPFPDDQGPGLEVRPGWQRYMGWLWLGLALAVLALGWHWRWYR